MTASNTSLLRQCARRKLDEPLQHAMKTSNSWSKYSLRGNLVQDFVCIGKLSTYFCLHSSFSSMTASNRSLLRQFGRRKPDEPLHAAIKRGSRWNKISWHGYLVDDFGWIGTLSTYFRLLNLYGVKSVVIMAIWPLWGGRTNSCGYKKGLSLE